MNLRDLLDLAQAALTAHGREDFIERTANYLDAFEVWQSHAPQIPTSPLERETLKQEILKLQNVHQQVLDSSVDARDEIAEAMRVLHRRAEGAKRYLDVLPSRISVTGVRRG